MAYQRCENCGCPVYSLGCTWCDEANYIEQQSYFDSLPEEYADSENEPRRFADVVPAKS